jgi:hypothetical protein
MKPNFFIAGSPKCGTSSMWYYLKQHPEIHMSADKEPHFYAKDLLTEYYRHTKESYENLFDSKKKINGDASTIYLYSKKAPEIIKKELKKDVKVLIMVRNPVDMMYSFHSQRLASGTEDEKDFVKALKINKIRKMGANPYLIVPYKEVASYDKHIRKWFDTFGKKNVKVLVFEEFAGNEEKAYKDVLKFLGVNDEFKAKFEVINSNNRVRSILLRDLLRDSWKLPKILQKMIKFVVPHSIRDKVRKFNDVYERRESLNKDVRKKVLKEMMPSVKRLEKLLGRDLKIWYS